MVRFIEKQFKSILNTVKVTDSWFWTKYTINPYNGCQFGCIYCDSRSAKYHLRNPEDFDNQIVVKTGITEVLNKSLKNKKSDVVGLGGTTDGYQPAEKKYRNSRTVLKVLEHYGFPVHIITKSTLIQEDLPTIDKIAKKSWASISSTITIFDEKLAKTIEKHAPSPQSRFDLLQEIKDEYPSIQFGITLMPIIPHLGDDKENIISIVETASDIGVDYILVGVGMTMRDLQATWYLQHISANCPEVIPLYEQTYDFSYTEEDYAGNYTPASKYFVDRQNMVFDIISQYNISTRMKRYIPDDFRKINFLIAEELLNESYYNQLQDKSWKTSFWVANHINDLSNSIIDLYRGETMHTIPNISENLINRISGLCDKYEKEFDIPSLDRWF